MGLNFFKNSETVVENIDLSEIDRESKFKHFRGRQEILLTILLTAFSCFQLYASITNRFPQQIVRYSHLGFAICLAYIIVPGHIEDGPEQAQHFRLVLAALFAAVTFYFLYNYKDLQLRAGAYTQLDVIMAGTGILFVLCACWRVVGPPIVCVASFFIIYGFIGPYLPGFLHHRDTPSSGSSPTYSSPPRESSGTPSE